MKENMIFKIKIPLLGEDHIRGTVVGVIHGTFRSRRLIMKFNPQD